MLIAFVSFLTAAIPSGFGMLIQRDFTSSVTNIDYFGMLLLLILLIKSLVSFTYDAISFIIGWSIIKVMVDIFRNFGRVAFDRADYGPTWIVFLVYF